MGIMKSLFIAFALVAMAATRASAYDVTEKSVFQLQEDLSSGRVTSAALVRAYLSGPLAKDVSVEPGKALARVCEKHGWPTFQPELEAVFNATTGNSLARNVKLLDDLCTAKVRKKEGWSELCRKLARTTLEAVEAYDEGKLKTEGWWSVDRADLLELERPAVESLEQASARTEDQRHDRDVDLVHQACGQVLVGDRRATGQRDVESPCGILGLSERRLNPVADEVEGGAALHLERFARVVGQHEDRMVEGGILAPPPPPALIRPRTTNRPEHVAAHNRCSHTVQHVRDHLTVDRMIFGVAEVPLVHKHFGTRSLPELFTLIGTLQKPTICAAGGAECAASSRMNENFACASSG